MQVIYQWQHCQTNPAGGHAESAVGVTKHLPRIAYLQHVLLLLLSTPKLVSMHDVAMLSSAAISPLADRIHIFTQQCACRMWVEIQDLWIHVLVFIFSLATAIVGVIRLAKEANFKQIQTISILVCQLSFHDVVPRMAKESSII